MGVPGVGRMTTLDGESHGNGGARAVLDCSGVWRVGVGVSIRYILAAFF